jgi:hypothetical protein
MAQEWLGHAVSVVRAVHGGIHPHATSAATASGIVQPVPAQCELIFSRYGDDSLCRRHYQKSDFQVAAQP